MGKLKFLFCLLYSFFTIHLKYLFYSIYFLFLPLFSLSLPYYQLVTLFLLLMLIFICVSTGYFFYVFPNLCTFFFISQFQLFNYLLLEPVLLFFKFIAPEKPFVSPNLIYIMVQFSGMLICFFFSCPSFSFNFLPAYLYYILHKLILPHYSSYRLLSGLYGFFLTGELFSEGWYGRKNREVSWVNHWFRCLCPVVLSPTQQEVGLVSCDGQHGGIQHLLPFSYQTTANSSMLPFHKNGMSFVFLVKFCVLAQGSEMPPTSPFPDLTLHGGRWFLSLEYFPTSGWLCVTWALGVTPLLSAFSLSQAQPDCINLKLDCFPILCIFSSLIVKNYFGYFQWDSKGRVGPDVLTLPS